MGLGVEWLKSLHSGKLESLASGVNEEAAADTEVKRDNGRQR